MARARIQHGPLVLAGLLLALLSTPGCGDERAPSPSPGPPPEEAPWSDPPGAERHATGSPDGEEAGEVQSPAAVLGRLRGRVARGEGQSDPSFQRDVENVAALLGPPEATPETQRAVQVHMQIAHIAGEVSHWLATSPEARAERLVSHPTDVAIHDAFLAATGQGLEAYRAWCVGAGAQLLTDYKEAQYRRLVPPPK